MARPPLSFGRRRPRLAAGSWHVPFEAWRSLLWADSQVRPTDWDEFILQVSQLPRMSVMFMQRHKEIGPGGFAKTPSPDELARRLAVIYEQTTVRDPGIDGIAIEMCGHSKTVVQWLRGIWDCHNNGYAQRIARV